MKYIDKFYSYRWGVFNHFLYVLQNNPNLPNSRGRVTSWDELVNEFDAKALARQLNEIGFLPKERFVNGKAQAHILCPLGTLDSGIGASWGSFGLAYDPEYIADYVSKLHEAGGVVTFDIGVYRDGSFSREQIEALKYVSGKTHK